MSKKVLIISTSLRRHSNSQALAEEFAKGAKEAGHQVELISLIGSQCVIEDDANLIAEKMLNADVICYATPIYYYEMAGQMKTLLDRMNPLFSADYKFRDVYMLSTAADDGPHVADRAVNGLEGWIECFAKAELAGSLFAGGVTGPGEITNHPALAKAYDMGKNI